MIIKHVIFCFSKAPHLRTDWYPGSKTDTFNINYKPDREHFKIPSFDKVKWNSEPKLNSSNENYKPFPETQRAVIVSINFSEYSL